MNTIRCAVCYMKHSTFPRWRASKMVEEMTPAIGAALNTRLNDNDNLLEVQDLRMYFAIRKGFLSQATGSVKAVDGVSFFIKPGETVGLVGESGCGKTTIGRCIVRAYDVTGGQMLYRQPDGTVVDLAQLE